MRIGCIACAQSIYLTVAQAEPFVGHEVVVYCNTPELITVFGPGRVGHRRHCNVWPMGMTHCRLATVLAAVPNRSTLSQHMWSTYVKNNGTEVGVANLVTSCHNGLVKSTLNIQKSQRPSNSGLFTWLRHNSAYLDFLSQAPRLAVSASGRS